MIYSSPFITKLYQKPQERFSFNAGELELDRYVLDKMRESLYQMDSQSIVQIKELFEKKTSIKEIVLKRIR
jgi:hypothetical protein